MTFSSPWRGLVDEFADQLAGAAGKDDIGGVIGEWLLDRDEIDDVFADDDRLGRVVIEQARRLASEAADARAEADAKADDLPEDELDLGADSDDDAEAEAWIARWMRRPFVPKTREGDGPTTASKFGGAAFLHEGEPWPVCPGCEQPMNLFVQLDLSTLPHELPYPHRGGMAQLFYCTSSEPLCEVDHEAWQPFGKSVVARWLSPQELALGSAPAHDPLPQPAAVVVVGWERGEPELPGYEEDVPPPPDSMDEIDESLRPRPGDKLGGWPSWVQGPEYPVCPQCKTQMVYLLQLESNGLCQHQFGDLGAGHLCQCPNHPEVVAFGWACH